MCFFILKYKLRKMYIINSYYFFKNESFPHIIHTFYVSKGDFELILTHNAK